MNTTFFGARGFVSAKAAWAATVVGMFFLSFASSFAATITVDDFGDTGPGNCSTACTLRDAIATAAQGDTIQFAPPNAPPRTITLSGNELFIYKSVNIVGPGAELLTIDAQQKSRLVEVALNADVTFAGIHFRNGAVTGTAGNANGTGGAAPGSPAYGGAFLVNPNTTLTLQESIVDNNSVLGGTGGIILGSGTRAGTGGNAYGGAIYNSGLLKVVRASVANNDATGGTGGADQVFMPGMANSAGTGGDAFGGGIAGPGEVELTNVVLANNRAAGGAGGSAILLFPGTRGGDSGNGVAGAIDAGGIAVLQFVTMAQNVATTGSPGTGATNGNFGTSLAADVLARSTVLSRSSIIASEGGSCAIDGGSFALQGEDFNEDGSCPGFTVASNLLKPVAQGLDGYWVAMPVYKSPVIDAARDCEDAFGNQVTTDVEGVSRPQGEACDVGAVESDYVFAADFEP
jgi:CSLREA domain-containing protein